MIHVSGGEGAIMSANRVTCEQLESRRFLSISTIHLPLPSGDAPVELAAGPSQTMWAIDQRRTSILDISAAGKARRFHLADRHDLSALTLGPDGNMWFADTHGGRSYFISRITSKGKVTDFRIPQKLQPIQMVSGPAGMLWLIATPDLNSEIDPSLISVTPRGRMTLHDLPPGALYASSLSPGPNNTLYLNIGLPGQGLFSPHWSVIQVDSSAHVLQSVSDPFFDGLPIFEASDGTVWGVFSEVEIFATSGDLNSRKTYFAANPVRTIWPGPENTVWFAGAYGGLGYVNPDGTPTLAPVPGNISVSAMALGGDRNFWISDGKTNTVSVFDTNSSLFSSSANGGSVPILPGATQTVVLADIHDFAPGAGLGQIRAQIKWDDGTSSAATLTEDSTGGFTLSTTRHFANLTDAASTVATYAISDTVIGQSTTGQASFINQYPLPTATPIKISATPGQTFQTNLAQLTGVDLSALTGYVISVDWGDGAKGSGTLAADGTGGAYVVGSHQYQHSGTFAISIGVSDPPIASGATQIKASVTSSAIVT